MIRPLTVAAARTLEDAARPGWQLASPRPVRRLYAMEYRGCYRYGVQADTVAEFLGLGLLTPYGQTPDGRQVYRVTQDGWQSLRAALPAPRRRKRLKREKE